MYTTFSIGTSCVVKNNEYAVPPPGAFHPDIPVHLLCSSTSLVVEHERAGETRVRQRACHFWQAARAGVPRCGTLSHIYSTATYIFSINHTLCDGTNRQTPAQDPVEECRYDSQTVMRYMEV
jgi:hypothetical protein